MIDYNKIDQLTNSIIKNETNHNKIKKIEIYLAGIKTKLKQAEYALNMIEYLCSPIEFETSTTNNEILNREEKISFYIDSFFAFLYSVFDIISQVINQKYLLLDEKKVRFKGLIDQKIQNKIQNKKLNDLIKKILKKHFFNQLYKYRNCSTHRREIYMTTIITSGTPAYTNITGAFPTIEIILCDDPLKMNPSTKKNRKVIPYCKNILKKTESSIVSILTILGE